jgi:methylmalonyl-CoA mutase
MNYFFDLIVTMLRIKKFALISVDPTKKENTRVRFLGDRIRLGSASFDTQFCIRSLATRNSKTELSPQIEKVVKLFKVTRL